MKDVDDLLIEIHTEELPPKSLAKLGQAFAENFKKHLCKHHIDFDSVKFFATPRRLGIFVKNLAASQPNQTIERKGPALGVAFDEQGEPSKACVGFARSVGVNPKQLTVIKNTHGSWVGYQQTVIGKSIKTLVPELLKTSIQELPIPKRMRWGMGETEFVRAVHAVIVLYGDEIIPCHVLGVDAGRATRGHRFLAPGWLTIPHAALYESFMETEGLVIVDFEKRKAMIHAATKAIVKKNFGELAEAYMPTELIDEVTGLVEWPVVLCGHFEERYLSLPQEVLISAMVDHQRYFPINQGKSLLPNFIVFSNINSHEETRVIHGNERVLRARLADAEFFYTTDQKESLERRTERLKGMLFQAKLGTLYDKSIRLSQIMGFIAAALKLDVSQAEQAGMLAKIDLTTEMVGEFPELQGIMGFYYTKAAGVPENVAIAMKEQYLPRYAGDEIAAHPLGQALSIADRIDTLVGIFGVNQLPTGDKDPYGLRRAAIGIIRTLVEKEIDLDLQDLITFTISCYQNPLPNKETLAQLLSFILERQRSWYLDQGIHADIFASVYALNISNPLDFHKRIAAVKTFKNLSVATQLSLANKRVNNILSQAQLDQHKSIDPTLFESSAEKILAKEITEKSNLVASLHQQRDYEKILVTLASLSEPVDVFFDKVMVMTDDPAKQQNRLVLLSKLRALFLKVADIAYLQ